jgi:arylsulfatase A-like enzyme
LAVWLVYGIVEFTLTCVVPLSSGDTVIARWQWPLIGQFFLVYALAGLFLGALAGVVPAAKRSCKLVALLTVVLAFIGNLAAAQQLIPADYIAGGITLLLALALTAALASPRWRLRLDFLSNPLTVSLLLLAMPWIAIDMLSGAAVWLKTAASVGALFAILLLSKLYHRLRWGRSAALKAQVAAAGIVLLLAIESMPIHADQPAAPAESGKPNIVFITMDTVRADHLTLYGYDRNTSPSLADFARSATVYTRAMAASDFTLPTHASMFTGLYPQWHGANFDPPDYPLGRPMNPSAITLADLLRSHGYRTAAVAANRGYLRSSMGVVRGFSELQSLRPVRLNARSLEFYLRQSADRILSRFEDTSAFEAVTLRASDINRRAYDFLDRVKPAAPFFLFLNYMDAHVPYIPEPPFDTMFPGSRDRFSENEFQDLKSAVVYGKQSLTADQKRALVSRYDGGIASIDFQIGKLLQSLRARGLYDNTLIVVISDHGEAFGEHGLLEHAVNSLYQTHVHVPLLIKYPHQSAAQQSDVLVSQVDLMPTILDWLGYPSPPGVQGHSLRNAGAPHEIFARSSDTSQPGSVRRAIFSGSLKLIQFTGRSPELYDLASDPGELHNLYQPGVPQTVELERRLAAWRASAPRPPAANGKLSPSSIEALKSLGYVQ